MHASGMAAILRNNKIMKRDRVSIYDKKRNMGSASYQKLVDHKVMNTWQYAAFQKEQFAKKRREKRKRNIIFIISTILAIIIVTFMFNTVHNFFLRN